MNLNKLLISYAGDFVSFFIKQVSDLKNIKNIILFGSVARGEVQELFRKFRARTKLLKVLEYR